MRTLSSIKINTWPSKAISNNKHCDDTNVLLIVKVAVSGGTSMRADQKGGLCFQCMVCSGLRARRPQAIWVLGCHVEDGGLAARIVCFHYVLVRFEYL